jgi:hypothetical protein
MTLKTSYRCSTCLRSKKVAWHSWPSSSAETCLGNMLDVERRSSGLSGKPVMGANNGAGAGDVGATACGSAELAVTDALSCFAPSERVGLWAGDAGAGSGACTLGSLAKVGSAAAALCRSGSAAALAGSTSALCASVSSSLLTLGGSLCGGCGSGCDTIGNWLFSLRTGSAATGSTATVGLVLAAHPMGLSRDGSKGNGENGHYGLRAEPWSHCTKYKA